MTYASLLCGDRFCPSVFIYLMCVVPAIWFLELHEMEKRIEKRSRTNITTIAQEILRNHGYQNETIEKGEELSASLGTVLGVSWLVGWLVVS